MVRVIVPATSANLGPGFDALGVALEIYNEVELAEADAPGVTIAVDAEAEHLGRPEHNLVYRAAERVFERVGYRPRGLVIRERVAIPVARGLGSSAAAIVGGLLGANALCARATGRAGLDARALLELAVEIEGHPDNVAPALVGGFTVATRTDAGAVEYVRFDPPEGVQAVVAIPETALSTKHSRGALPQTVPLADAAFNLNRAALLVAALATRRWDLLPVAMQDRLHQPYRAPLVPGLAAALEAAVAAGADGAALSGAGPSVLALVAHAHRAEAVAAAMAAALDRAGSRCRTLVVGLAARGAHLA